MFVYMKTLQGTFKLTASQHFQRKTPRDLTGFCGFLKPQTEGAVSIPLFFSIPGAARKTCACWDAMLGK